MSTSSTKTGLWTLGFGEVGATLKGLEDAGATPELLARFRSNKKDDKNWAVAMVRLMLGSDEISETIPEPVKAALLELVRTADGEVQEAFRANDFFKEKDQPDGIKFWLGDNLKTNFLSGTGKIEFDVPASTLNVYKLREASVDAPIIATLSGNDIAKTSLAYMAQLIKAQPKGPDSPAGPLLINGWPNVFYIEDDNGVLWAVDCHWYSDYRLWRVEAYPVTSQGRWLTVNQFFSPAVLES